MDWNKVEHAQPKCNFGTVAGLQWGHGTRKTGSYCTRNALKHNWWQWLGMLAAV